MFQTNNNFNYFYLVNVNNLILYFYIIGVYNSLLWKLGIGDWGLGPIPNPQSPTLIKILVIFIII